MHVRVLRIQQKQFLVCIYFYLSYSSLLYFLSLRSCVFHQFWKTLGHLGLKLLVSCFFVIDRNLSVVQLGETPRTYVPLHQLSLQLNLTGSITSPLTYCFVLFFFPRQPGSFPTIIFSHWYFSLPTFMPLIDIVYHIFGGLSHGVVSTEWFYPSFN